MPVGSTDRQREPQAVTVKEPERGIESGAAPPRNGADPALSRNSLVSWNRTTARGDNLGRYVRNLPRRLQNVTPINVEKVDCPVLGKQERRNR
jgi:hypothetical protein